MPYHSVLIISVNGLHKQPIAKGHGIHGLTSEFVFDTGFLGVTRRMMPKLTKIRDGPLCLKKEKR
jgi:hypothetical protein